MHETSSVATGYNKTDITKCESLSVHHQESSTVHTAIGRGHTGYADCLLAGSGS